MAVSVLAIVAFAIAYLLYTFIDSLFLNPLAKIPGPKLFALTRLRLAYEDYVGTRTRTFAKLHQKYGPVVRVGPNEVIFNTMSALRTIYGAGSGFERTDFYRMFDVYGRMNMFSFRSAKDHAERKRLLAHAYSKSTTLKGETTSIVESKVGKYMELLEREMSRTGSIETYSTLHYFTLDSITEFLYGKFGRTSCLDGVEKDRALMNDTLDVARRKLSWFTVHLPGFTSWLYSRKGIVGSVARCFYPMRVPTTNTGVRTHALKAVQEFAHVPEAQKLEESTLVAKMWKNHRQQKQNGTGLDEYDIAAELADHLLAGISTTADNSMFLIWCLSLTENQKYQQKLIEEVRSIPDDQINADGVPQVVATDKLRYVDAVIKESLRLFAPIPSSEPRSSATTSTIDGYVIPPRTVVSMSPYNMHRNPEVFEDPLKFDPDRWLDDRLDTAEMNRWLWAFSSGARMCIGLQYESLPFCFFPSSQFKILTVCYTTLVLQCPS